MRTKLFNSLKWNCKTLKKDILSGIVIALVSIPISMGYAQVAGLPAVYGLYGSLLPILIYSLSGSSPQFIVGVDAMPAVMVGTSLAAFGITAESPEAMAVIPAISLLVAMWMFIFRLFKAGSIVKYISTPVMGGFITGVGLTIILMQIPKLFGGNAGTGEITELIPHIIHEFKYFNLISCILGIGTVIVIQLFKKFCPKFPASVIMLVIGIVLTACFHIDKVGVKLLPAVQSGLPKFIIPDMTSLSSHLSDWIILSLMIAAVIMAQTLLSANAYATKYDYQIDNNRELVAYSLMNTASCICGSCPINGSVSRTGMSDQFGSRSQVVSIVSFVTMFFILIFATKYFVFLPVPILTGIVLSALIGILDFKQMARLWKCNKEELLIFVTACLGVLFLGTIYGVIIGVLLSFLQVVKKAVVPPRDFRGKIPGQHGYYNIERTSNCHPIKNTVIYRFGGNLFFANIGTFQNDILGAINDDTKYVIVDASGIGNIDITAADRLVYLAEKLEKKGIKFFLTEHPYIVNDQLRNFGAEKLLENGNIRRTVSLALKNCGFKKPYPLEGTADESKMMYSDSDEYLAEFEWAFGNDAESKMKEMADRIAGEMVSSISDDNESSETAIQNINIEKLTNHSSWGQIGLIDEEELLDNLEIKLEELYTNGMLNHEILEQLELKIENRKNDVEKKVHTLSPLAITLLHRHMTEVEDYLKENNPAEYERLNILKKKIHEKMHK